MPLGTLDPPSAGSGGKELGYDQITSPVNVASTTEATGTTIITCAAHTFDGAPVMATFYAPYYENGSASIAQVTICLFESTTQIARLVTFGLATATLQAVLTGSAHYRFTPTAGSHTYTVTAFANNTSGTPQVGAGPGGTNSYGPCFIRFTKV